MEDPQPVYFIGISLPPELDRQIADLKWELHDTGKHLLKPVLPHVTLLHPPSLRGIMPDELLPRIHEIAERYLPMTLSLEEIGFFGESICYIRVQSLALISLQSQLVKLLPPPVRALHYRREYSPHITLAQVYEPLKLDVERLKRELPGRLKLPQKITIDSVACFMRILPREYRAEAI